MLRDLRQHAMLEAQPKSRRDPATLVKHCAITLQLLVDIVIAHADCQDGPFPRNATSRLAELQLHTPGSCAVRA